MPCVGLYDFGILTLHFSRDWLLITERLICHGQTVLFSSLHVSLDRGKRLFCVSTILCSNIAMAQNAVLRPAIEAFISRCGSTHWNPLGFQVMEDVNLEYLVGP